MDPSLSEKTFYVYLIQNKINGKIYVGKTVNPKKRWVKHKYDATSHLIRDKFYLQNAMNKYGKENFDFSVIEKHNNEQDQNQAEIFHIAYLKSLGAQLYNLTEGGDGWAGYRHSEETKQKLSEMFKGRKVSEETKLKMRKPKTEDAIKKTTAGLMRKYETDPEFKKKMQGVAAYARGFGNFKRDFIGAKGEKHQRSILKEKDVLEIRNLLKTTSYSCRQVAEMYNVTRATVSNIKLNRTWKHI